MACTACALHSLLPQLRSAQASCSARPVPSAISKAQYTTCTSTAGVCRRNRHQLRLRHGSLDGVQQLRCAASSPDSTAEVAGGPDDEAVLTKEEDWTVPGGANDSLSSNTHLGRAVQDACDELETLGGLEQETIEKANVLLRKLGYRVTDQQEAGEVSEE